MPAFARAILIQESAEGGLSYKVKNPLRQSVFHYLLEDISLI